MYVPDHSDVTASWSWGCEGSGDMGKNISIMVSVLGSSRKSVLGIAEELRGGDQSTLPGEGGSRNK